MNKYLVADDIRNLLFGEVQLPTTVMWNRLEGRPRRTDFSRALKAEVRDPLWMITRQWQMGEFIGEDAGSPVTAKVAWNTDLVAELRAGATTLPYDPDVPLEAIVEARPVSLQRAGRIHNADLRLAMGRQWKRMLEEAGHGARVPDFLTAYGFKAPDPNVAGDFPVTAHAAAWQTLAAIANRAIDGGRLFLHLSTTGAHASDGLGLVDPEKGDFDVLGDHFLAWAKRQYVQQPEDLKTWNPTHLEYSAVLSAPSQDQPAAVAAPEYRGGRLDWYSFDAVAPDHFAGAARQPPAVTSFMPASVQFDGMPNRRHWTFEEGGVNFGDIDPDTTDIAKLLLIEFGLVFADDWFLLPIDVPVGSLTAIRGVAVTNVFGERIWVEPAVTAATVQNWRMFRLSGKGVADDRLFVPAATPVGLESGPVESVAFVRDEVSNMVWAIETAVQLADGSTRRGRELAGELHARHQAEFPPPASPPTPTNAAAVKYVLMTSVAEHWVPFIPVHVDGSNREVQLQRAAMPRMLENAEGIAPAKIAPRTALVRGGLDLAAASSYFIAEEEVERAGTMVETRWQRCRWRDGRVITWLGNRRTTGRGEAASGLAFDVVVPKSAG